MLYIRVREYIVNMPKKIIFIIIIASLLIIGLVASGYFYWINKSKIRFLEEVGDAAQKITDSATKGVLPSLETNPLENKPDINPADKANPIKNIKINPFE